MCKMSLSKKFIAIGFAAVMLLGFHQAEAKKQPKPVIFPIGVLQEMKQEQFTAELFYLKPYPLGLEAATLEPKQADIHLRACVRAAEGNTLGLKDKELIPGLTLSYTLTKLETKEQLTGTLFALENEEGPCYGDNLKLPGTGTYKCEFTLAKDGQETAPVNLTWIFKYIPHTKW